MSVWHSYKADIGRLLAGMSDCLIPNFSVYSTGRMISIVCVYINILDVVQSTTHDGHMHRFTKDR